MRVSTPDITFVSMASSNEKAETSLPLPQPELDPDTLRSDLRDFLQELREAQRERVLAGLPLVAFYSTESPRIRRLSIAALCRMTLAVDWGSCRGSWTRCPWSGMVLGVDWCSSKPACRSFKKVGTTPTHLHVKEKDNGLDSELVCVCSKTGAGRAADHHPAVAPAAGGGDQERRPGEEGPQ